MKLEEKLLEELKNTDYNEIKKRLFGKSFKFNKENFPSIKFLLEEKEKFRDNLYLYYHLNLAVWNKDYRKKNEKILKFILVNSSFKGFYFENILQTFLKKNEINYYTKKIAKRIEFLRENQNLNESLQEDYFLAEYFFKGILKAKMYLFKMINTKNDLQQYLNYEVNELKYLVKFIASEVMIIPENKEYLNLFIQEYKRVLRKFEKMKDSELEEILSKEENENIFKILMDTLKARKIVSLENFLEVYGKEYPREIKVIKRIFRIYLKLYPENCLFF